MKTKWKGAFAIALSCLLLAGCGGPKTVSNQQMTLNLSYGDRSGTYTGEVNDQNVPNGKGKFTTKNTQGEPWYYEGHFENGHFDGEGKTVWTNSGQEQTGTYKNDRLNGKGKFVSKNHPENNYEGNFEGGLPALDTVPMNQEVSYADWTYKVTGVTVRNSAGNRQARGEYLVVTIDDTNNGAQTRQPGAQQFFCVYDKTNGKVYRMDDEANLADQLSTFSTGDWFLSEVNPGLSVQNVKLYFDIPKDTSIDNMKFIPSKGFGKVSPVQLSL